MRPATRTTTAVMMIGVQFRCWATLTTGAGRRGPPPRAPCDDGRAPGALPAPAVLLPELVGDFALTRTVPGLREEEFPPPCGVLMLMGPRCDRKGGQGKPGRTAVSTRWWHDGSPSSPRVYPR